jgi:hypothetical protein
LTVATAVIATKNLITRTKNDNSPKPNLERLLFFGRRCRNTIAALRKRQRAADEQ